jgi:hypothetical protein
MFVHPIANPAPAGASVDPGGTGIRIVLSNADCHPSGTVISTARVFATEGIDGQPAPSPHGSPAQRAPPGRIK